MCLSLSVSTTCRPLEEEKRAVFSFSRMWVGTFEGVFVRLDLVSFSFLSFVERFMAVFEVNRGENKRFDVWYCVWKRGGRGISGSWED